ncbi:MAG: hypothetical protein J4F50_12465, partial [Acidimicrobiia bacterium]|nr:hypothetical protein [Acidimicrobiia bacterium]
ALAAFDATDPVPGNGFADIFGCPESWICDKIITNMIAFSGWDNIQQTIAGYDAMFVQAVDSANEGIPMVAYTWTPSEYITQLRPGDNVYWAGVGAILDDSNPANQEGGEWHDQRGADGTGGFAKIGPDQCPSAADQFDGLCPIGWIAADILVTANNDFLSANPAARALFEVVRLSVIDVSLANLAQDGGASPTDLAVQWVADNRDLVDEWMVAALKGTYVSVLVSAGSESAAQRARDSLESQYGREFGILLSSDYASLRPGYWVVYAGPFVTPEESQTTCWTDLNRRTGDLCYGRRLSQDPADADTVYGPAPG